MELITVPRLRIGELQALTENVLKICKPLPELKTDLDSLSALLKTFAESMQLAKASSADKYETDKTRDRLLSGLFHCIKSDSHFPYSNDPDRELAEELATISEKYRSKIRKLPLNEETAAIDNLLAEIRAVNPKALQQSDAGKWIGLIEQANEEFKATELGYISDKASQSGVESPTKLVPELSKAINQLCLKVFSYAQVSNKKAFETAYSELYLLIDKLQ